MKTRIFGKKYRHEKLENGFFVGVEMDRRNQDGRLIPLGFFQI
jgi:hypothetical protein